MEKQDFLNKLWEMVKATPIEKVAEMRTEVYQSGRNKKCLCPFHNDSSAGSFILGGNINIFKCFACGEKGDGINLIAHFDKVSNKEAMLIIALEFGYITPEQKVELSIAGKNKGYNFDDDIENKFIPFEENEVSLNIAPVEVLNNVFTLFKEGNALLNEPGLSLSKEHEVYLMRERGLTKEELEENGFFTFPEQVIIGNFYERLYSDYGYTPMILKDVPGFYGADFFIDTTNYSFSNEGDVNAFLFTDMQGIGIPIKDVQGNIIGIQVRLDEATGNGLRYVWFSSSWAMNDKSIKYCTPSGAPKDVTRPKKVKNTTVFITEGKFKAIEIAKTFGSLAISVQGVTTWRGIEELIVDLSSTLSKPIKNVVIAYDADMSYNMAIAKQTLLMAKAISEATGITVNIAVWDVKFGKGIDDLIQAGHLQKIDRTEYENFEKWMVPFLFEADKLWKKNKSPKNEMNQLFHEKVLSNFPKYRETKEHSA